MENKTNILDLINKKKNNKKLSQEDFDFFILNILNGEIKDYQISAFLMAIFLNGLDFNETYFLTKSMVDNSYILEYPDIPKPIIDKHSTGGIGDKVTIILSPIVASFGLKLAKISGKGLGYTGGTIDKLNSIGVKTDLTEKESLKILNENGFFIIEQNKNIVPSDKILYSIRDTSGTVDNISLIVASIMSKKIVTNADLIYLDVKIGDGGFFKNIAEARLFSKYCIDIGKKFKKKVVVHLTNMDFPLGKAIGNLIEIKEAYDFLNDNCDSEPLHNLICEFVKDILIDTKKAKDENQAYEMIEEKIKNKEALECFLAWAKNQKSTFDLKNINKLYEPKFKHIISAQDNGFLSFKSNKLFGMCLIKLKGGRLNKTDELDYYSGIYLNKSINDYVAKNAPIITIYSSEEIPQEVISEIENNIIYNPEKIQCKDMILEVIK